MASTAHTVVPASGAEMFLRPGRDSVFFARPASTYTDFFDVDVDDLARDSGSEFEEDDYDDDDEESPRESFDSYGVHSTTTVTSYDVATPAIDQKPAFDSVRIRRSQSTQGPSGPHLFRYSSESIRDLQFNFEGALQLSPILPKDAPNDLAAIARSPVSNSATPRPFQLLGVPEPSYRQKDVESWTPQDVALWMQSIGVEESIVSNFEVNDVDGAVLLQLQMDDLKQLDIASFGKRHHVWNAISGLKATGTTSPLLTPIHDDISKPIQRSLTAGRSAHKKQQCQHSHTDEVAPQESISIVAIEQYIPPEHHCNKGDKCPKYRQRERIIRQLERDYPNPLSPTHKGHFFVAGDPGNPSTAAAIQTDSFHLASNVIPSVVASSDVLGPGSMPEIALQEQHLRNVVRRDPQENVKQFLTFQHLQPSTPENTPPSPPAETPRYEMFPAQTPTYPRPLSRSSQPPLPKLAIPQRSNSTRTTRTGHFFSPVESTPQYYPQRLGTPASEADIPIALDTTADLPALDRDASQSVPPNMQFRPQVRRRPDSRETKPWHRSSMTLPSVPESAIVPFAPPLPAPPGPGYLDRAHTDPSSLLSPGNADARLARAQRYGPATTHAGWMKKRRTRLLMRHDWASAHFRLTGTQLAMHATEDAADRRALETIDVDDYAVACSSLAANGKLAAALKMLKINGGGSGSTGGGGKLERGLDDSAFIFQLVPSAVERAGLLRRMAAVGGGGGAGAGADAKTHQFAVRSSDERIDWMREVMLAKAVRAKKQVVVNGRRVSGEGKEAQQQQQQQQQQRA